MGILVVLLIFKIVRIYYFEMEMGTVIKFWMTGLNVNCEYVKGEI